MSQTLDNALRVDGLAFCEDNQLRIYTLGDIEVVKHDDILNAIGLPDTFKFGDEDFNAKVYARRLKYHEDPTKFHEVKDIPHVLWCLKMNIAV